MEHQIIRRDFKVKEASAVRELYKRHYEKLGDYIDKLLWWNEKINLVSRGVSRETVAQHVEHSLVINESQIFELGNNIIDAGAGGGLPGIPLGIVSPKKNIVLNDVVSKKIMACKNIANGLRLNNVQTEAKSIGEIKVAPKSVIVSKHAFKINDLLNMIDQKAWLGVILLKGGEEVGAELEGVKEPLKVNIINLEQGFSGSFYDGKAMVEIQRRGEE